MKRSMCCIWAGLLIAGCSSSKNESGQFSEPISREKTSSGCSLEAKTFRHRSSGRVVALGDFHGDLEQSLVAMRSAGIINDEGHWDGGTTIVVQTGDLLDRGNDEPQILALVKQLSVEAKAAGGAFLALNGNHEFMNGLGDFRYVTDEGFSDFSQYQGQVEGKVPDFARGRAAAFAPGGPISKELAARNLAVIVDDTVFVHGGIVAKHASNLEALNLEARCFLDGQGPPPKAIMDSDGPVWSRAFSGQVADCEGLSKSLEILGVKRMVVGHTVQPGGINSACDEAIWRIDVGMAAHYGGRPQALEILTHDGATTLRSVP